MSTFRSIEELVKSLERERELLKEMFAKRKSLSFRYDYALEMTEYKEERIRYLIDYGVIRDTGDFLEMEDLYLKFFEDVLEVNEEINVSFVQDYLTRLNENIDYYLKESNEKRKYNYQREVKRCLKNIALTTVRNVMDLKRNMDNTYKNEPNYQIKKAKLMRLSEKLKNISLLITKSEELIDNQQPVFFRVAMDVQMRNVVSDVKLQLNDSYHNLLEIHRQIVHYLNLIDYQNRIFEKDFLSNKAQVTVAPYKVVTSSLDLEDIDLSKNYVLKTATGGYDGHGQKVITSAEDLEEANALANSAECVLEEFVNFDLEISVIVSGNGKDVTVFPVQENIHRNNILSKTIVPARISDRLADRAKAIAVKIAEQLNLSGTLCVEMFATADDIIVNEIAPRPHNSGHYSIEACDFSQFDTHILGVLGAPLPAINLHEPAVMLNVLGQHVEAAERYVTENPSAHLHMYGKLEAKHNRKMGHVTLFSNEPDNVVEFGKGIDF